MWTVLRSLGSGTQVDDPELWLELVDCWIQELLAAERDDFVDLPRTWQKTRRALAAWQPCIVDHGASAELYDHLLGTKPLNGARDATVPAAPSVSVVTPHTVIASLCA